MLITKEAFLLALQKNLFEYVHDYHDSEITEQDVHNALTGQTHRTISDLGLDSLDSLDVLEVVMAIEDTFDVDFEDYLDEDILPDTLVEKLPALFEELVTYPR